VETRVRRSDRVRPVRHRRDGRIQQHRTHPDPVHLAARGRGLPPLRRGRNNSRSGVEALRKSGTGDVAWGQRVVISPPTVQHPALGGWRTSGRFSWSSDTPCFVFTAQLGNGNEKYTAEAASHEARATRWALYHDGVTGRQRLLRRPLRLGHPSMGVGYNQALGPVEQGRCYRREQPPNTISRRSRATVHLQARRSRRHRGRRHGAVVSNSTSMSGSGIIERRDKDCFSFLAGAGTIALKTSRARQEARISTFGPSSLTRRA